MRTTQKSKGIRQVHHSKIKRNANQKGGNTTDFQSDGYFRLAYFETREMFEMIPFDPQIIRPRFHSNLCRLILNMVTAHPNSITVILMDLKKYIESTPVGYIYLHDFYKGVLNDFGISFETNPKRKVPWTLYDFFVHAMVKGVLEDGFHNIETDTLHRVYVDVLSIVNSFFIQAGHRISNLSRGILESVKRLSLRNPVIASMFYECYQTYDNKARWVIPLHEFTFQDYDRDSTHFRQFTDELRFQEAIRRDAEIEREVPVLSFKDRRPSNVTDEEVVREVCSKDDIFGRCLQDRKSCSKKDYRDLMLRWHPDKNDQNIPLRFKNICFDRINMMRHES